MSTDNLKFEYGCEEGNPCIHGINLPEHFKMPEHFKNGIPVAGIIYRLAVKAIEQLPYGVRLEGYAGVYRVESGRIVYRD